MTRLEFCFIKLCKQEQIQAITTKIACHLYEISYKEINVIYKAEGEKMHINMKIFFKCLKSLKKK